MICKDNELSRLDEELGKVYKMKISKSENVKQEKIEQLAWMKNRNSCDSVDCLTRAYEDRISVLKKEMASDVSDLDANKVTMANLEQKIIDVTPSENRNVVNDKIVNIYPAVDVNSIKKLDKYYFSAKLKSGAEIAFDDKGIVMYQGLLILSTKPHNIRDGYVWDDKNNQIVEDVSHADYKDCFLSVTNDLNKVKDRSKYYTELSVSAGKVFGEIKPLVISLRDQGNKLSEEYSKGNDNLSKMVTSCFVDRIHSR